MKLRRMNVLPAGAKSRDDCVPEHMGESWWFWCPGCNSPHQYRTKRPHGDESSPLWEFNGNETRPTFTPSLLMHGWTQPGSKKRVGQCHLHLRDGQIRYLSDCDHSLAGQTVELVDLPSGWF